MSGKLDSRLSEEIRVDMQRRPPSFLSTSGEIECNYENVYRIGYEVAADKVKQVTK